MFYSIYIDGFRCLENFTLSLVDLGAPLKIALLLGPNGSGKSNVFYALHLLCRIAQGETSLKNLIDRTDFPYGETQRLMTFEIKCEIDADHYRYLLEVEQPENFYQPRIRKESLSSGGVELFLREGGRTMLQKNAEFVLDWHHAGLPLIHVRDENDSIARFALIGFDF